MKISNIHIDGFGKFHHWNGSLSPGLNIISGRNEAGKTTLAAFIRFILFGFPKYSRDLNRYPPLDGGNHGGHIDLLSDNGKLITIERIIRATQHLSVTLEHEKYGEERLLELLGPVDLDLFDKIFSINQDELPRSDLLSDDHVRSMLHGAGMGLDPGLIERVKEEFSESMDSIFKPKGRKMLINDRLHQIDELDDAIRNAEQNWQIYNQNITEIEQIQGQIDENNKNRSDFIDRRDEINELLNYEEDYNKYCDKKKELNLISLNDGISPDGLARFQKLNGHRSEIIKRLDSLKSGNSWHEQENIQTTFLREKENILNFWKQNALYSQQIALIQKLELSLNEKRNQVENASQCKINDLEEIFYHLPDPLPTDKEIKKQYHPLNEVQQTLINCQEKLKETDQERELLKSSLDEHRISYQKYQERTNSGSSVRITASPLIIPSILLISGIILIILGSISDSFFMTAGMVAVGAVIIVVGILILLRSSRSQPVIREDSEEIIRLANLLKEKEEHYSDLGELRKKIEAEKALNIEIQDAVVLEWNQWLSSHNLPPDLTADQAIGLIGKLRDLSDIIQEMHEMQEKTAEITKFTSGYENAVKSLCSQLDFPLSGTVMETVEELYKQYQNAEEFQREKTETLALESKRKKDLENEQQALDSINKEVINLFQAAGCTTESEFMEIYARFEKKEKLESEIKTIQGRFGAIKKVNGDFTVGLKLLESTDFPRLKEEKLDMDRNINALDPLINNNYEKIGKLKKKCEEIEENSSAADLRFERNLAIEAVHRLAEKWAVYAVGILLLEASVNRYERERQPGVVKEAERIFKQITGNNYKEISIPLTSPQINIRNIQGSRKEIPELSRGTADQLYLALRLGYIREFQKTAEKMPLLLDEILINSDPIRMKEACKALAEFSKTNQILYFTCHPETIEFLKESIPETKIINLNSK